MKKFSKLDAGIIMSWLTGLPLAAKKALLIIVDASLVSFSVWLSLSLRLAEFVSLDEIWVLCIIASSIIILIFAICGVYQIILRYSSIDFPAQIGKALLIYSTITILVVMVVGLEGIPRSTAISQPLILYFFIISSRVWIHYLLTVFGRKSLVGINSQRVFIYGAGQAGSQLAIALKRSVVVQIFGFLDDDPKLHNRYIFGLKVLPPSELELLIVRYNLSHVIIAMPSISRRRRSEILNNLSGYKVVVNTLPGLSDIVGGKIGIEDIKEFNVEDLLGREPVSHSAEMVVSHLKKKTVLVTGAGGSIGSELARQIIRCNPLYLILLDSNEYSLYSIEAELLSLRENSESNISTSIITLLGSIQDEMFVSRGFQTWRPQIVYHSAAYKHVPLVEANIIQGLKNNVFGTLNLVVAAAEYKVEDFTLVSSDKAVRPTNVMGASKRVSELILQAFQSSDRIHLTKFSMVRFGNVLGSSGSIIPKIRREIREGGPVLVTHEEVTRYFMTISEAAQLVLQSSKAAVGGDVFLLDMGKPVKIIDLAKQMIALSGLAIRDQDNPEGDIEIKIIGLRPGEKLYEELLIDPSQSEYIDNKIYRATEPFIAEKELLQLLEKLKSAIDHDDHATTIKVLKELVVDYKQNPC
jgi:FlaA1/EpsC-like NDP-sugar epimerase